MTNTNTNADTTRSDALLRSNLAAHSATLFFAPCTDRTQRAQTASEISKRFLRTAALLRAGEYLGLQIEFTEETSCTGSVFSSPGTAAPEDCLWMFRQCADLCPFPADTLQDLYGDGRRVYRLAANAWSPVHSDEDTYDECESDDALFEMLRKTGAVIRIVAGASEKAGYAAVYISLPKEISLRIRSAFSYTFPYTAIEEAVEPSVPCETDRIPDSCLQEVLKTLLCALTLSPEELDASRREELIDALADHTIDEMELSVRSYNRLKRADIDTADELLQMSDDELQHILMSRKCYAEVKTALHKLTAEQVAETQHVPLQTKSHMEMLEELIGLENVKEQVRRIAAFAKMKKDMRKKGLDSVSVVLNMEFVGNPGTAKTTVARIVAGILHEIGLISRSDLTEVGRADLVGKYEGQTAAKVKEVFQSAMGGVLFIDEAYSLTEHWDGGYGDEAISTIVQEMENNRDNIIVIFAGYPDPMKNFIERNPGLRSRVPFHLSFQDYSTEELAGIAELEAGRRGFAISEDARDRMTALLAGTANRPEMGNGRFCRNLIENAILHFASRVYGCGDTPAETDFLLSAEDFSAPSSHEAEKKLPIGFRS